MSRVASRLFVVVAAAAATVTAVAQQPTFRAGVEVVRVDVSVTRDAAPVAGLRLDDFEVRDQGVRQQVSGLLYEEVPLDGYLVLDTSRSVAGQKLIDLRRAALAFLAGLQAGDRAALITFSHEVTQHQSLTSDLAAVRRALDAVTASGTTALNDALFAAMLQRRPNERRSVAVVFSDGLENSSWLSENEVLGTAERGDTLVYGVTLTREPGSGSDWEQPTAPSPAQPSSSYSEGRLDRLQTLSPESAGRVPLPAENAFLRRVTAATGGRIWAAGSSAQLEAAFVAVLRDIRSRYLLTYTPEPPAKPGWHALQVKLRRGKGQVIARPGYFVR